MRTSLTCLVFLLLLAAPGIVEAYDEWREAEALTRYDEDLREKVEALDDDLVEDLQVPVLFGVKVEDLTENFGDPRGGGTRTHEGLDMMTALGTPIVSPTESVVLRTTDGPSSGLTVYTANPGGETFVYMHLDAIADIEPGDELREGDLIGYLGATGNANGFAHLHFEIRDEGALDPFPRLTRDFSLEEKMEFLEDILDNIRNDDELAEFLVETYPGTFLSAQAQGIDLPRLIEGDLERANLSSDVADLDGTLRAGDSGSEVITLQSFLIRANLGNAAARLARAGATGYFGSITTAALEEYQAGVGLEETGVFDRATRNFINGLADDTDEEVELEPAERENDRDEITDLTELIAALLLQINQLLARIPEVADTDLTIGDEGRDVRLVQTFLIFKNTGPAAKTLAGYGATGYYGDITAAALREYQFSSEVSATGVYDSATRQAMSAQN